MNRDQQPVRGRDGDDLVAESRRERGAFMERLKGLVVEDAPTSAVGRALSAFGDGTGGGAIDRIAALLVRDLDVVPGLAGVRGVDTATGRHLLYRADPHDLTLSIFEDDGWRLIGQLLVDSDTPAPTLVELEVDGHRAVTRVDPTTGEFDFEHLPTGRARLVFIGPHSEVTVDAIPLERET